MTGPAPWMPRGSRPAPGAPHPHQRLKITVLNRRAKNQRLAVAGYVWAFSAISASPGARGTPDGGEGAASNTMPRRARLLRSES